MLIKRRLASMGIFSCNVLYLVLMNLFFSLQPTYTHAHKHARCPLHPVPKKEKTKKKYPCTYMHKCQIKESRH